MGPICCMLIRLSVFHNLQFLWTSKSGTFKNFNFTMKQNSKFLRVVTRTTLNCIVFSQRTWFRANNAYIYIHYYRHRRLHELGKKNQRPETVVSHRTRTSVNNSFAPKVLQVFLYSVAQPQNEKRVGVKWKVTSCETFHRCDRFQRNWDDKRIAGKTETTLSRVSRDNARGISLSWKKSALYDRQRADNRCKERTVHRSPIAKNNHARVIGHVRSAVAQQSTRSSAAHRSTRRNLFRVFQFGPGSESAARHTDPRWPFIMIELLR